MAKRKKEWGVGGKIEKGERPRDAMIREFEEETGIPDTSWQHMCTLWVDGEWEVFFYWSIGDIHSAKATTDEAPEVVPTNKLPDDVIENIPWLVHLAMDRNADKYNVRSYA